MNLIQKIVNWFKPKKTLVLSERGKCFYIYCTNIVNNTENGTIAMYESFLNDVLKNSPQCTRYEVAAGYIEYINELTGGNPLDE